MYFYLSDAYVCVNYFLGILSTLFYDIYIGVSSPLKIRNGYKNLYGGGGQVIFSKQRQGYKELKIIDNISG